FLDFRSNGFQFVVLATNQHHPVAECGQFMCSATADAAATAGNNDVLAGKKVRTKYGAVAHQWLTSLAISSETGIGKSSSICANALPCGSMRSEAMPPPPRAFFSRKLKALKPGSSQRCTLPVFSSSTWRI